MGAHGVGRWLGVAAVVLVMGCWRGPGPAVEAPPVTAQVLPAKAILTAGHALAFAARVDGDPAQGVVWSVLEAGGGRVDGAGKYRAPAAPGVYTVRATFKAGPGLAAAAKVTVVAPPAGEIIAPRRVMPDAPDQVARIAPAPGSQYHWTITGGTITGGTDTASVSFRSGNGPKLVLACKVTNAAGDGLNSSLEVPVAARVVLTIKPTAVTITAERGMKFGFDLVGGTSLGVVWKLGEPGAGRLDPSGKYVAPSVPGLYTVRVDSADDPTVGAIAKVKVVAKPPESLYAPDSFLPGAEALRARVPELAGMAYAWEIEGGTITAGSASAAMQFEAGKGPALTLRCRISNAAGDSFTASKVLKAR
jgi:large repetitive protein